MKKLIYFPIIHNEVDLGSMGSEIKSEGEKKYGITEWKQHLENIENSWDVVKIAICNQIKDISYSNIKIYQDGLPIDGEIGLKIIKDLSIKGSKNYQIIEDLVSKGAQIIVAENKEYLIEEYTYIKNIIDSTDNPPLQFKNQLIYQDVVDELLNKRDEYITDKINTTLNDNELGIAFFGSMHSILNKINKDIVTIKLDVFKYI